MSSDVVMVEFKSREWDGKVFDPTYVVFDPICLFFV